jgi:segregation and condensation protein B
MRLSLKLRILETALLCSSQPLSIEDIRLLFDEPLDEAAIHLLLCNIGDEWSAKGIELTHVASGWRFQSRGAMTPYLQRLNHEKAPKYTRAALETLAIIAYKQPVTRGDIEEIRGVAINTSQLKQLEERGWIEAVGHKESIGRPTLYATTKKFLDDLGLMYLADLPALHTPESNSLHLTECNSTAASDTEQKLTKYE